MLTVLSLKEARDIVRDQEEEEDRSSGYGKREDVEKRKGSLFGRLNERLGI